MFDSKEEKSFSDISDKLGPVNDDSTPDFIAPVLYEIVNVGGPELNPSIEQLTAVLKNGAELSYITPESSTTDLRVLCPSGGVDILAKSQTKTTGVNLQTAYNGKFFFLSRQCELSPTGQLPGLTASTAEGNQWSRRIRPSERIISCCNSYDWSNHAW